MDDAALVSEEKRDERGRFLVPPKSPGRPRSSRNKLGEEFIHALAEDFAVNGKQAIEDVRRDKPDAYLKVIAQVVPKEVHYRVEDIDELSDDAIEAKLIELLTARAEGGSAKAGRGIGAEARAQGSKAALPN